MVSFKTRSQGARVNDEKIAELMDLARENERAIAELRVQVTHLAERISSGDVEGRPRSA